MASDLTIRSGFSSNFTELGVATELKDMIGETSGGTLFFFAAGPYSQTSLNGALGASFPDCQRIGVATHGAFDGQGFAKAGVSALYIQASDLRVTAHMAEKVSQPPYSSPKTAVSRAFDDFGLDPTDIDFKKTFGILLDGGSPNKREFMLAGISEIAPWLTLMGVSTPFVGFLRYSPSQVGIVHLNGHVATDAAVFVLVQAERPWRMMRIHPYRPTGNSLMVTHTDLRKFLLKELNGRGAVEEMTTALGGNLRQKSYVSADGLVEYPLGIKVGREYFIRAVARFAEDGQLQTMGSMLPEGRPVDLMINDNEEAAYEAFQQEIAAKLGNLAGALLLGSFSVVKPTSPDTPLAKAFAGIPTAGGAGVFQLYNGLNLSHTLTVLGFGS